MATLAQQILDLKPVAWSRWDREHELAMWDHARLRLRPPRLDDPEDVLRRKAQRYSFHEDIPQLAAHLQATDQIPLKTAFRICRTPHACMWAEFPLEMCVVEEGERDDVPRRFRAGALVEESPDGSHRRVLLFGRHWQQRDHVFAIADLRLYNWPVVENITPERLREWSHGRGVDVERTAEKVASGSNVDLPYLQLEWVTRNNSGAVGERIGFRSEKELMDGIWSEIRMYVTALTYALALLTIPRVAELRESEAPSPALAKRRAREGREPEVRVTNVRLRVSRPPVRYERHELSPQLSGAGGPSKRAWHMVDGHFRTYLRYPSGAPRPEPKVVYIEEHERGDPAFGIRIKQTEVTR